MTMKITPLGLPNGGRLLLPRCCLEVEPPERFPPGPPKPAVVPRTSRRMASALHHQGLSGPRRSLCAPRSSNRKPSSGRAAPRAPPNRRAKSDTA